MIFSNAGTKMLIHHEGYRKVAYDDGFGFMTIGIGHLIRRDENWLLTATLTDTQIKTILMSDLTEAQSAVRRLVKVPINQNQFDALTSFTFNVGSGNFQSSTLRRLLNEGDYTGASNEFWKWRRSNGKIAGGLVRRRADEKALFLTPIKQT